MHIDGCTVHPPTCTHRRKMDRRLESDSVASFCALFLLLDEEEEEDVVVVVVEGRDMSVS